MATKDQAGLSMTVYISESAKSDLKEIEDAIVPLRRDAVIQAILDHCETLATMPHRYPLVPRYEVWGLRRCVYGHYLIFYRTRDESVEVIHIVHGSRDYDSMLFSP
ncbi:MAG TPA: type II toxin-antitoxin system RelE/ParE family toxin [Steroidobacteraceae bacterium]|nr:type II toxin-antitoxin system RelE/ParE family toxin [Steroidobacteraceae bacterium]